VVSYKPASAVSSYSSDCSAFQVLANAIADLFPEAKLSPTIMVASTDTKYYGHLAENIYRFSPLQLSVTQTSMYHGLNEQIGVEAYEKLFQFYHRLTYIADAEGDNGRNFADSLHSTRVEF